MGADYTTEQETAEAIRSDVKRTLLSFRNKYVVKSCEEALW